MARGDIVMLVAGSGPVCFTKVYPRLHLRLYFAIVTLHSLGVWSCQSRRYQIGLDRAGNRVPLGVFPVLFEQPVSFTRNILA